MKDRFIEGRSIGMLLRTPGHLTRAIAKIPWIRSATYPTNCIHKTAYGSCCWWSLDRYWG